MVTEIKVGRTKVRVMRKEVDERSGRETVRELHRGVIVAHTTAFAKVFNPLPKDKGGDVSPQTCEAFALNGPRCWCESLGDLDENRAIAIPPEMRG